MNTELSIQWVDKYRPKTSNDILGNADNIIQIKEWLQNFKDKQIHNQKTFKNAILISGSPGIGKTTAAHIMLKEAGFDTIEFNVQNREHQKNYR